MTRKLLILFDLWNAKSHLLPKSSVLNSHIYLLICDLGEYEVEINARGHISVTDDIFVSPKNDQPRMYHLTKDDRILKIPHTLFLLAAGDYFNFC